MTADLAPARVQAMLATGRFGRSLTLLSETDSTNDDARRAAEGGVPDGHVVVADSQRLGRGSKGRSWASPAGTDLYVSIVDRPRLPISALPPLTLAVGLGVARAADALLDAPELGPSRVKWPNDVWIGGRKCAGILIEGSSVGDTAGPVVIGIGLNVNRLNWPEELAPVATSLRAARPGQAPVDRAHALATLLGCVEDTVDAFLARGAAAIVAELEPRLALRGEQVRCEALTGVLEGVAPSGAVRLSTEAGPRELFAGTLTRL